MDKREQLEGMKETLKMINDIKIWKIIKSEMKKQVTENIFDLVNNKLKIEPHIIKYAIRYGKFNDKQKDKLKSLL
jgi:hypothetical protein